MQQDKKSPQAVIYTLRHLLTANITDPLSDESRGRTEYTQYLSGDGTVGQVLRLERKPITSGRFSLYDGTTLLVETTNYTLDRTAMTVTSVTPFTNSTDNLTLIYDAVLPWVYDDHPFLSTAKFPRITIDEIGEDFENSGLGEYFTYSTGPGNLITMNLKIIVRNRKSTNFYTYGSQKLQNMDLVNAIAEQIILYFQNNRRTPPWKIWDWEINQPTRNRNEEDSDIFRKDIALKVRYYHTSA